MNCRSGPAYSIQGRPSNKNSLSEPGPGQYQINSDSTSYYGAVGIGTSQRSNLGRGDASKLPGPGHYSNVDHRGGSLSYSMGTSKRKEQKTLDVPGPGAYKIPYMVT